MNRFLRLAAVLGLALALMISMNARTGNVVLAGTDPCATVPATEDPATIQPTDEPATTVPGTDVPTATDVPATDVPTATDTIAPTSTEIPPTSTDIPPTSTDIPPTSTDIPPTSTSIPPTSTQQPIGNGGLLASNSQQPGSLAGLQQAGCPTATSPAVVDPTSGPVPTEAPVVVLPNTGTGSSNTGSATLLIVALVAVAGVAMRLRHSFRR